MTPAERFPAWAVGGFLLLLTLPLYPSIPGPGTLVEPLAGWPLLWLAVLGPLGFFLGSGRWLSWPLAALLAWALARSALEGFQGRATWCLLLMVGAYGLYRVASSLPARAEPILLKAVAAAACAQVILGSLDVLGWNPLIQITSSRLLGFPHGTMLHPNHFGVFLSLALPAILAIRWRVPSVTLLVPFAAAVALSRSRAGILGLLPPMLWAASWVWERSLPRWSRRRIACATGLALGTIVGSLAGAAHLANPTLLWTLGGRTPAWTMAAIDWWAAAWPAKVLGGGLGTWLLWSQAPMGRLRKIGVPELGLREHGRFGGWWESAMNEPLQLQFELGAIGLLIGAWVVWQVVRDIGAAFAGEAIEHRYNRAASIPGESARLDRIDWTTERRAWACTATTALLVMTVAPIFHHPALAALTIIAAARLRALSDVLLPPPRRTLQEHLVPSAHRDRWLGMLALSLAVRERARAALLGAGKRRRIKVR